MEQNDNSVLYVVGIFVCILIIIFGSLFMMMGIGIFITFRREAAEQGGVAGGAGGGTLIYPAGLPPESIADCLNEWMRRTRPTSPLVGMGLVFAQAGQEYNVNPALMIAIAAHESQLGTAGSGPPHHNPFGWGCPPCEDFSSWQEAIRTVTRKIRENYLNEGRDTIEKIQQKYAPIGAENDPHGLNQDWISGVTNFFNSIISSCPALGITIGESIPVEGGKILAVACIGEDYPRQCGAASVCMVINYLTGRCSSTSGLVGSQTSPDLVGLLNTYTNVRWRRTIQDKALAIKSINAGYPVVLYTGLYGKHIVTLVGYDGQGYFYYNDPVRNKGCHPRQKTTWGGWGEYPDPERRNMMIVPVTIN